MKMFKLLFFTAFYLLLISASLAQELQVITHQTFKYDTLGKEIVFDFEVVNISPDTQIVFEVRTINNLPLDWTSSLCFGQLCFPPDTDSIATTPPLPEPPLAPNDTLITSLHVYTLNTNGTAYVQIQVGTFSNPNQRVTLNFIATTDPSVNIESEENPAANYYLAQNYPNPFNPSTKIDYYVRESGHVSLKVFNILGVEVSTLVNEFKSVGNYSAIFNADRLSSGVYIYKLDVNGYSQTRKMILEK